ncbi:unnamed protein product, partial [Prorocentrum cordatum]
GAADGPRARQDAKGAAAKGAAAEGAAAEGKPQPEKPTLYSGGPNRLLWCVGSAGSADLTARAASAMQRYGGTQLTLRNFKKWVFLIKRRPDVTPYATLVVGWPEAEDCVCAVEDDGLYQPRTWTSLALGQAGARGALSTVIVFVADADEKARAEDFISWWESNAGERAAKHVENDDPKIFVASTIEELQRLLAATAGSPRAAATAAPRRAARGRGRLHDGAREHVGGGAPGFPEGVGAEIQSGA